MAGKGTTLEARQNLAVFLKSSRPMLDYCSGQTINLWRLLGILCRIYTLRELDTAVPVSNSLHKKA